MNDKLSFNAPVVLFYPEMYLKSIKHRDQSKSRPVLLGTPAHILPVRPQLSLHPLRQGCQIGALPPYKLGLGEAHARDVEVLRQVAEQGAVDRGGLFSARGVPENEFVG